MNKLHIIPICNLYVITYKLHINYISVYIASYCKLAASSSKPNRRLCLPFTGVNSSDGYHIGDPTHPGPQCTSNYHPRYVYMVRM